VWRGALDALVEEPDRLRVVEFKTGRRRPSHEAQLALYVAAIRAIFPGREVEGELVYLTLPAED
jgi:ATP-dependent helicase/nuclease subunit A